MGRKADICWRFERLLAVRKATYRLSVVPGLVRTQPTPVRLTPAARASRGVPFVGEQRRLAATEGDGMAGSTKGTRRTSSRCAHTTAEGARAGHRMRPCRTGWIPSRSRFPGNRWARRLVVVGATLLGLAFLAAPAFAVLGDATTPPPWISSDQPDYQPGGTVVLTGGNWQPAEGVHIVVNDDQSQTWNHTTDVTADDTGAITDTFQLPSSFIAVYSVTATGPRSGTATTSFTDGNVKLHASPSGTTYTATVTKYTGSSTCAIGAGSPTTVTGVDATGKNIAGGANLGDSLKVQPASTSDQGGAFVNWTSSDPFTDLGSAAICVAGFSGGGTRDYTANYTTNLRPTVSANSASVSVNEGSTAASGGTYNDANIGDNPTISASVGTITKTGTNSGNWSWSFATNDGPAQSQTVTITADDGHPGGTSSTTFSLTVNNVAPTAAFSAPSSVDEGSNINLSLTSPNDPSTVDTAAGFTYAFDCGDGSGFGAFSTTNTAACPTTDNGTRTVGGKIRDKDGGTTTSTALLTIDNVAPTVTAPLSQSANEGASTSFQVGSFTDPGANDNPWAVDVNWGDATTHTTFNQATTGSLGSASHTYADNGTYTVTVKVTDKDGGSGSKTFTITVANVAPTLTPPSNQSANEGASTSFQVGSFSDPGADSPWSVDVNWGDATTHTTFTRTTTGALPDQSHTYADNGTYTVTVKITDKDSASGTTTFTITVANVAPTATFNAPASVDEGSAIHLSLTSPSDPSAADTTAGFTYAFDCGDGSGYGAFGGSSTATCPTTDNGTRSVGGTIRDKDAGTTEYTASVTVANVAPTAPLA